MTRQEISCQVCEAEFYIEIEEDPIYCVVCGEVLEEPPEPEFSEDYD